MSLCSWLAGSFTPGWQQSHCIYGWGDFFMNIRNQILQSFSRIQDVALWDEPKIEVECQSVCSQ